MGRCVDTRRGGWADALAPRRVVNLACLGPSSQAATGLADDGSYQRRHTAAPLPGSCSPAESSVACEGVRPLTPRDAPCATATALKAARTRVPALAGASLAAAGQGAACHPCAGGNAVGVHDSTSLTLPHKHCCVGDAPPLQQLQGCPLRSHPAQHSTCRWPHPPTHPLLRPCPPPPAAAAPCTAAAPSAGCHCPPHSPPGGSSPGRRSAGAWAGR